MFAFIAGVIHFVETVSIVVNNIISIFLVEGHLLILLIHLHIIAKSLLQMDYLC